MGGSQEENLQRGRSRSNSGDSQTRSSQNTSVKKSRSISPPIAGHGNLLGRATQYAPSASTAGESSSSSNPAKERMTKDIQSIKDKVKKAKEDASKTKNITIVELIDSFMKKVMKAYDTQKWQECSENLNALKEVVNNFIESQETWGQEEQQENARKEEKNKQKWSGPARASKISEEISKSKYFYLYRKMATEEANKIFEKWGQTEGHEQQKALAEVTADDNGRKWLSTTPEHSKIFSNENVDQGTKQVILKITLDSQKYNNLLESRLPAKQTGAQDRKNKNKVLIHQELLAEGNIANTKNESELDKIFTERENYNAGFSNEIIGKLDNAIKKIEKI